MWLNQDNFWYGMIYDRWVVCLMFGMYELVIEIFICLLVPLIIKPCREEFIGKDFQNIALRYINKHSIGFLMSHLLGLFSVLFFLEKYGFNLITVAAIE